MGPPLHYFDTNVLIAIIEPVAPLTDVQSAFLVKLDRGEAIAVSSEFALAECLVKPYADNNDTAVASYLSLFNARRGLIAVSVTQEILVRAARVRAETRMSLPDAVHVSTAEILGCAVFVSEDRGIRSRTSFRLSTWMELQPAS